MYRNETIFTAKKIILRNEVDRFGFSYILSKRFGLTKVPKSFACFAHGWIWRADLKVEDFGYYYNPRKIPIVVATKYHQEFLVHLGFQNVYAGALPFAYVEKSNIKRKAKSLLIIPPHSMRLNKICGLDSKLLNYVETIKICFSEICFCLHADEYEDQEIINSLKQKNIKFILGADPCDANSLYRTREIFDYYDYVTTTTMGSHILYAAFCGCKVSLLKNYRYFYAKNTFMNHFMVQSLKGHDERLLNNLNNVLNLESEFPWLFVDHPLEAVQMTDWANEEIGFSNLLSKDLMMNVLGWTLSSKMKALLLAIYYRATRLLSTRFSG